jgi:MoxR-like ATPase
LQALFDRFLLRCHVTSLNRAAMPALLTAGWALENYQASESGVSAAHLRVLGGKLHQVALGQVMDVYLETVGKIRDLGIPYSDRRAVKVLKLLAASALLCGRDNANSSDLWVLRYVWDREEQIEPLQVLVNGVLEQHADDPARHPLASVQPAADGEDIGRQLDLLDGEIDGAKLSLSALARLRDRVSSLADQAAWVGEAQSRTYLLEKAKKLLHRLG